MHRIKTFFWSCAGANHSLLKKCSTESSKYVGIGASILFTGLFAALAAGYALFTVFDNCTWSIIFALVWGAMIFNLDRFIVSSMRKNGQPRKEWMSAVPRILLAILISIVVARPLELKVFEKEIDSEIALMQVEDRNQKIEAVRQNYYSVRERLNFEIQQLKNEIEQKTMKRDELRRIAQHEADGTGGSMQRNAGPIYQIKKANADQVENELQEAKAINQALMQAKDSLLVAINVEEQVAISALEDGQLTGLASRITALERLKEKSNAIWLANLFILLLFIFLETAPIFVKLMSARGPYDYLLRKEEYGFESAYYEDLARVTASIKKKGKKLSSQEREYLDLRLDLGLEQT